MSMSTALLSPSNLAGQWGEEGRVVCGISAGSKGVPIADWNEERGDVGAGGYVREPSSTERLDQVHTKLDR